VLRQSQVGTRSTGSVLHQVERRCPYPTWKPSRPSRRTRIEPEGHLGSCAHTARPAYPRPSESIAKAPGRRSVGGDRAGRAPFHRDLRTHHPLWMVGSPHWISARAGCRRLPPQNGGIAAVQVAAGGGRAQCWPARDGPPAGADRSPRLFPRQRGWSDGPSCKKSLLSLGPQGGRGQGHRREWRECFGRADAVTTRAPAATLPSAARSRACTCAYYMNHARRIVRIERGIGRRGMRAVRYFGATQA